MTTERLKWTAVAAGTAAIAVLCAGIGAGARSEAVGADSEALVARLTAAIDATPGPDGAEALAAATRAALAATDEVTAGVQFVVATDEDFTTGWSSARGARHLP